MNRNLLLTAGSVGLLLAGRKISALGMFARGVWGLEKEWRANHTEVGPTFAERWAASAKHYEATHQNTTNRVLHIVGIPMILGGLAGLLISKPVRPLWIASAASFGVGWALNLAGHAFFEKNKPAFAQDPLSFVAGPVWDFQQLFRRGASQGEDKPEYTNGHYQEVSAQ